MVDLGVPMHTEDVALFSVPPVNVAQDKIMWVEHLPTFGKGGKGSIQFNIPGSGNQYTDLSKTFLYVKISVRRKNGSVFNQDTSNQTAIPIDNVLHSLWSMVDIKFNQALVSSTGTNYMYKAYLESLLNFSHNTKTIQMSMIGFSGESGNLAETDPDELPYNTGLLKRYSWFKAIHTKYIKDENGNDRLTPRQIENNEALDPEECWSDPQFIEFKGTLLADVCNQDRLILNGVDIDIKLWPNRDEFRLITFPDNTEAYIDVEDIRLDVCKVTVASETVLGIESTLLKTPACYPLARTDIRTFNISGGSYSTVVEDMFQGEVPTRLILGMVDSEGYSGNTQLNPYRFNHFNIANLAFYVDGEPTPRAPMDFNFKEGEYLQGLHSLYQTLGKVNENTDIGIDRVSYRQGNALFGLEVDPTSSANLAYIGKPKKGRTRLVLRFHKSLEKPVTLIVYAVFPDVMLIDQARIVSLREKEKAIAKLGIIR